MTKLLEDIKFESWGLSYSPVITEEFETLIESALEKIMPFSNKEVSAYTNYFIVRGEELPSEYDCCNNEKCIKAAKSKIRSEYGKGTHIEVRNTDGGDAEIISYCSVCNKPLDDSLTYCREDLEYLESNTWGAQFFIKEAFLIRVMLESTPTMDCNISQYAKKQGGKSLEDELEEREMFFQRIAKLAQAVRDTNFEEKS